MIAVMAAIDVGNGKIDLVDRGLKGHDGSEQFDGCAIDALRWHDRERRMVQ
jgi:hypothetical protein